MGIQNTYAQIEDNYLSNIIRLSKNHKLEKARGIIDTMNNSELKKLLILELDYSIEKSSENFDINKLKGRELYISRYLKANLIGREEQGKDSLIYKMYIKSFNQAKEAKDTLVVNEILNKLNWHLFRNSNELKTFRKYIDISEFFKKDSIDRFYVHYYNLGYELLAVDQELKKMDTLWFEKTFKDGYNLTNVSYLKALLQQLHSIYYGSYLSDFKRGLLYNRKAIFNYEKDSTFVSQKGAKSVKFNVGVDYYNQGKYEIAIPILKKDLKNQSNVLYQMYGYDWLYKSYEGLKLYDSAYYYFKKMVSTKDNLNRLKHARDIKRIEGEFDLTKKEKELKLLSKEKNNLRNSLYTLIPILSVITLILIFIFYLYKSYKKRSKVLEKDQSETLQKLDELKKIVIKNHIILKDKTKVYIADLMYIKSDDHYLNVFLSDGKNHFVRGKLNAITEELPPNFIRCHRSYIVNSNFIKQVNSDTIILIDKTQIPLSRSYKDKF